MLDKKGLTKLVEECGELIQVAAKKMNRMDSDFHWDNAGSLATRLEEEMGDVLAAIEVVTENLKLGPTAILERKKQKVALFRSWMHEDDTTVNELSNYEPTRNS